MQIHDEDRDEIIHSLINSMSGGEERIRYEEITKRYKDKHYTPGAIMEEILPMLKGLGLMQTNSSLLAGRLTARGLEIKRIGGWHVYRKQQREESERKELREIAELENLKYSTRLTKKQLKWHDAALVIGFVGGLAGILSICIDMYKFFSPEKRDIRQEITLPKNPEMKSDSIDRSGIIQDTTQAD